MTLCLAFVSPEVAGLVSDRRLTSIGGSTTVLDEEFDKSGVVDFCDGRLAYSLAGLATFGDEYAADLFIGEALARSGDGRLTTDALKAFASELTGKLATLPSIDKRTTVVFAGFVRGDEGVDRGIIAIVSNFEYLDGSVIDGRTDELKLSYELLDQGAGALRKIGSGSLRIEELQSIYELLQKPIDVSAIVNQIVRHIRAASERQASGTVGKRCTSVCVARGEGGAARSDYHAVGVSRMMRYSSYVYARHDSGGAYALMRLHAAGLDPSGRALASRVQKVPRNSPCPCSSGLKYKKCHMRSDLGAFGSKPATEANISTYGYIVKYPTEDISILRTMDKDGGIWSVEYLH